MQEIDRPSDAIQGKGSSAMTMKLETWSPEEFFSEIPLLSLKHF
jgi:hypothetical protein